MHVGTDSVRGERGRVGEEEKRSCFGFGRAQSSNIDSVLLFFFFLGFLVLRPPLLVVRLSFCLGPCTSDLNQ